MQYSNIYKYLCIGIHLLQGIIKIKKWLICFFFSENGDSKEIIWQPGKSERRVGTSPGENVHGHSGTINHSGMP